MKQFKTTLYALLGIFGISFFFGYVFFAIGMGSLFTELNQVARPFVCGAQPLEVEQYVNSYRPGETSWSVQAYCVTETGEKVERTGWVQLVAGLIYSILPFIVLSVLALRAMSARKKREQEYPSLLNVPASPSPSAWDFSQPEPASALMEEKLEKLKRLRDADLISAEDYQKKKDEILKNL
jgi:hypothetical protein